MRHCAQAQLFHSLVPIHFRSPFGASAGLPQLVRQCGNFAMSEGMVPIMLLMRAVCVLVFVLVARLFMRRQMLFLPVFARGVVGMPSDVVQLGRPLMILVMRSVVISSRHISDTHDLPALVPGFLCQFIRLIGIFKRPLRVPYRARVIAFFVVLRGGPMGTRRQFVQFSRLPV